MQQAHYSNSPQHTPAPPKGASALHPAPVLEVRHLSISFRMYDAGLNQQDLEVISDLDITAYPGEILAIAGSSGSGKSLLAHAVLGLLPANATVKGSLFFKEEKITPKRMIQLRGREIALIPQSVNYLDPLMQVAKQVRGTNKSASMVQNQKNVFAQLGLDVNTETMYPFQLSGGMARRVLFSTAVLSDAQLIVADEPTPGMHPQQAMEALGILRELANQGKSVILITHDIDLAFSFADRVAVFYAGTTVEEAPVANFIAGPQELRHPYSKALWEALPQNGFKPLEGFQPYAKSLPPGCLFAPRCKDKTKECEAGRPHPQWLRDGMVRCIHAT